jgi:ABC-2 type transport system permease protein
VRGLLASWQVEALKARRSLVPWLAGVITALPPVMLGVMMAIKKDPTHARQLGLLTTKTKMFVGAADWPTFLGLMGQMMGAMGIALFTVVVAWVFGREFAEHTCRVMLATTVKRREIVGGKLGVAAMWCLLLAAWMVGVAFVVGAVVGMPGLTWGAAGSVLAASARAVALALALLPVSAFVASVGRGYLLPIGWAFVTMLLTQFIGATGWSTWFPWSVVASSGIAGTPVGAGSILVVVFTGALGMVGTLLWWERADQTV